MAWTKHSFLNPYRTNGGRFPVIDFGSLTNDLTPSKIGWTYTLTNGVHTMYKDIYASDLAEFISTFEPFYNLLTFPSDISGTTGAVYWQFTNSPNEKITGAYQFSSYVYRLCSNKFINGIGFMSLIPTTGNVYGIRGGLGLFTNDSNSAYSGDYIGFVQSYGGETSGVFGGRLNITLYNIYDVFAHDLEIPTEDEEENPDYPQPSDGGGYDPDPDDTSDPVPIPPIPEIGFSNSGLYNVYKISNKALIGLASDLFQDVDINFEGISGVEDTLKAIGDLLKNGLNMFISNNLVQFILDCHILPCSPTVSGSSNIDIGFREFSQTGENVITDYVDINCGTLEIPEYYGNYIDYVGTEFELYLPFIGTVPILPEYIQNGSISVTYRFNVIDGTCVAFVVSSSSKSNLRNSVIGEYSGTCCIHLPITGENYSNVVSGLLNGSLSTLSSMTSKSPSSKNNESVSMSKTVKTLSNVSSALDVLSLSPTMQGSNGYNSSSGFLGVRKPYLIVKRVVASFSRGYDHEKGLPSNVYKKLSSLIGLGFNVIDNIDLTGLNIVDDERDELISLLTTGVYF